jgi:hypothetical protein
MLTKSVPIYRRIPISISAIVHAIDEFAEKHGTLEFKSLSAHLTPILPEAYASPRIVVSWKKLGLL